MLVKTAQGYQKFDEKGNPASPPNLSKDEAEAHKPEDKTIDGTNCANCKWSKGGETKKVTPDQLNDQGGYDSTTKEELARAKKVDLITFPLHGAELPQFIKWCKHEDVDQFVNERMCCNMWDEPGTHRAFTKEDPNA